MTGEHATSKDTGKKSTFWRADRVSKTRSMLFYGIGTLIGLIIGGIGLFNARGTTTNVVPPQDVALVNSVPILRSDFETQLETETGTPFNQASREEKLRVLDEMVREELMVQRGLELDFAETDQAARNALYSAVEQQALAEVTTSRPTEDDLHKQYSQHPEKYATEGIIVSHNLIVPVSEGRSEEEAKAIAKQVADALRGGAGLEDVTARFPVTEDKFYGEDFYFAAKIHMGDVLYEAVVDKDPGSVSDPVKLDDGYHVVQIVSNQRPRPLSFEQARAQVLNDYRNAQQSRLMNNTLTFLRNRSRILIADDYKADYEPQPYSAGGLQ